MREAGISSWLLVYSLPRYMMMIDDAEKKEEATMHFF